MSIFHNYVEIAAMILFGVGFTTLLLHKNMIKKIIGFSIMDCAIFLFLAAKGYIEGRRAPIVENGIQEMEAYINPIPAGLVLTGIVVSVSVTAVMLALTVRLYRRYHSLDIDEITQLCRMEDEPDVISIGNNSARVELPQMRAFEERSLQQGSSLMQAGTEDEPDVIVIGNTTIPATTESRKEEER